MTGASTQLDGWPTEAEAPLRSLYRRYREHQIISLLSLLPEGAVRPLYRSARSWAVHQEVHQEKDPLATLVRYCEALMPLPPFHVWVEDFKAHRGAYLQDLGAAPLGVEAGVPVKVDVRSLVEDGRRWYAALSVLRKDGAWRGYVTFQAEGSHASVRTADIFRSQEPAEIRERFQEFDRHTLAAFLRSTLP